MACIDHSVVAGMIERLELRRDGRRLLTYGTAAGADLTLKSARVEGSQMFFDADLGPRVRGGARALKGWSIPLLGHHNALNALAAIAAASEADIGDDVMRKALAGFSGVKRRFQPTGTWNGVTIYDDYGHHPVEIAAVMKAAKAGARGRRASCRSTASTMLRWARQSAPAATPASPPSTASARSRPC